MAQLPTNPVTPNGERGSQWAAGLLIAGALLLIGCRWLGDYSRPRPADLQHDASSTHRVELNRATRSELMQLPGVGPTRADKILAVRTSRGGFQRVEDLRAVDGIGDITFARLKPHLTVANSEESADQPVRLSRKPVEVSKSTSVKKPGPDGLVDLNRASVSDLQRLPGIGPTLAQRIIDERERKPFTKVEDLRRVSGIGVKRLEQVRPYVVVKE